MYKKITICFIVYLVVSITTVPFIDSIWLGEIPVLAVVQLPKTMPANFIRHYYASSMAKTLNISKGSFSPDAIFIRPYALLIVYIIPLLILVFTYVLFIKDKKKDAKYLLIVLLLFILDYFFVLHFSDTPGLTIY